MEIVKNIIQETRREWMRSTDAADFHAESRSLHDEVRYRLQDRGYDGIIHDWKPEINRDELDRKGQTKVTTVRGTEYLLKTNPKYGGLDLFYYEEDAPGKEGEHLTGYSDLEDFLSLQEYTVVCFKPEQIKAVTNRTPTKGPNFKENFMEENFMNKQMELIYTDSYGDDNIVYPKLNFYLENNNLYVGLDCYEPEIEAMDNYCDVTVNIEDLPYLHAAIDTNNNGPKMVDFLEKNGFGEPTGLMVFSGFAHTLCSVSMQRN